MLKFSEYFLPQVQISVALGFYLLQHSLPVSDATPFLGSSFHSWCWTLWNFVANRTLELETQYLYLYDISMLYMQTGIVSVPLGDLRTGTLLWSRTSCYWDTNSYEWLQQNTLFLKSGHWQRCAGWAPRATLIMSGCLTHAVFLSVLLTDSCLNRLHRALSSW